MSRSLRCLLPSTSRILYRRGARVRRLALETMFQESLAVLPPMRSHKIPRLALLLSAVVAW